MIFKIPAQPFRPIPVLGLGFLLFICSCDTSASTQRLFPEAEKQDSSYSLIIEDLNPKTEWNKVMSFSGKSDKRSPSFALSGHRLKMAYKTQGGPESLVGVYLVKKMDTLSQNGGSLELLLNGTNSEEKYLRGRRGEYYLEVLSEKGSWSITMEEASN